MTSTVLKENRTKLDLSTLEIKNGAEALASGIPVFKFVMDRPITVSKDRGDGLKRVHLVASSSATDLAGDVMSEKALRRMKETAVGKTMFLNHSTNVPEDVFGCIESAILVQRSVQIQTVGAAESFANIPVICLEYDVIIEESNPRAVKTWEIINNGKTTLGASVTIAVVDKTRLPDGRQRLEDVYHLETSIVGVPCNQTSWVDYVTKSGWAVVAKKAAQRDDSVTLEFSDPAELDLEKLLKGEAGDTLELAEPKRFITRQDLAEVPIPNAAPAAPAPGGSAPTVEKELTSMLTTAKEALEKSVSLIGNLTGKAAALAVSIKDMFTERLENYLHSPYLYQDILSSAICELVWWNDSMPSADRLAIASEMLDAFKAKMMEIFADIFADQESEKSKGVTTGMKEAMSKAVGAHYAALSERVQLLAKAGARNSKSDTETLTKIHNSSHDVHQCLLSLGVECKDMEANGTESEVVATEEKKVTFAGVELTYRTLPELEEQLTKFSQQVADAAVAKQTELEAKVAGLEVEKKSLALDLALEKTKTGTAIALAESYANLPAPRPSSVS